MYVITHFLTTTTFSSLFNHFHWNIGFLAILGFTSVQPGTNKCVSPRFNSSSQGKGWIMLRYYNVCEYGTPN